MREYTGPRPRIWILIGMLFGPACTITAVLTMAGAPFELSGLVAGGCWAAAAYLGSRRLLTEEQWEGVTTATAGASTADDGRYRYVPDNTSRDGPMVYFARPGDPGPAFQIVHPGQAALVNGPVGSGSTRATGDAIYGPFVGSVVTFGAISGVMLQSFHAAVLATAAVAIGFAVIYLTTRLAAQIINTATDRHRFSQLAADGVRAKPGDRGGTSRRRANTPYLPPPQHTASIRTRPRTALGNKGTTLRALHGEGADD